jgi:hypothetical protein
MAPLLSFILALSSTATGATDAPLRLSILESAAPDAAQRLENARAQWLLEEARPLPPKTWWIGVLSGGALTAAGAILSVYSSITLWGPCVKNGCDFSSDSGFVWLERILVRVASYAALFAGGALLAVSSDRLKERHLRLQRRNAWPSLGPEQPAPQTFSPLRVRPEPSLREAAVF